MTEMVERVRAAIFHAERFGRDRAEAAVEAMREPTEAMVSAALGAFGEHFNDHDDGHMVRQIHRAMNGAALGRPVSPSPAPASRRR